MILLLIYVKKKQLALFDLSYSEAVADGTDTEAMMIAAAPLFV